MLNLVQQICRGFVPNNLVGRKVLLAYFLRRNQNASTLTSADTIIEGNLKREGVHCMDIKMFLVGAALMALLALPANAQFYKQTNLVSDIAGMAQIQDPQLVNPWGVSLSTRSPFWVSNAGSSVSTLYSVDPTTGTVTKASLVVSVPVPSGQVHNGITTDFLLSGSPAAFIFAGLNGNVYGWTGGSSATLAASGPSPAAYTGITIGLLAGSQNLYTANPAGNRIDVYDHTFANVNASFAGKWIDLTLPAGLVPFNIASINGQLFVSYTPANPMMTGPGVINVFDTAGNFLRRFATGGTLLSPWGMVVAPSDFGAFSKALLVGNFNLGNSANGPGNISAFDLTTGNFLGLLQGTDSGPLQIDGLWQLIFGNGGSGGNPSVLYFSAGIQNQMHGLFGSLNACGGPVITDASATPNVLWPPNNKFVSVSIGYTVTDNCDNEPLCSLSVTAADSGGGIDRLSDSAIVVDDHTVQLRASRNGGGDGRIYSVEITCKDKLPLSSRAIATVIVPHDRGK